MRSEKVMKHASDEGGECDEGEACEPVNMSDCADALDCGCWSTVRWLISTSCRLALRTVPLSPQIWSHSLPHLRDDGGAFKSSA